MLEACWDTLNVQWPRTVAGALNPIWFQVEDGMEGKDRTYILYPFPGALYSYSVGRVNPDISPNAEDRNMFSQIGPNSSERMVMVPAKYLLFMQRSTPINDVRPPLVYVRPGLTYLSRIVS